MSMAMLNSSQNPSNLLELLTNYEV